MTTVLITLFIANSIAHVVSFNNLNKIKAPNAKGVLVFVFINAAIAVLLWQKVNWAKWPALIFPALGGLGLLTTTILKGKATWIDYVIFALDLIIIGLVLKLILF